MKIVCSFLVFFVICHSAVGGESDSRSSIWIDTLTPNGGTIVHKSLEAGNPYQLANSSCRNRNLGEVSSLPLLEVTPKFYKKYSFICAGIQSSEKESGGYVPESNDSSPPQTKVSNISQYQDACKEIGFKPKTEKFGDCVLELKKRDKTQPTNTSVTIIRGDGTQDDTQCISYGYKLGSEAYASCRQKLDQSKKLQADQERRYQEQLKIQQRQEAQMQQTQAAQQDKADRQRRVDGLELIFRGMQGTGARSPSPSTMPHFLRSQYYSNGNHMCNYDDGTVINVGAGICPNIR